jgi:glycosyltransferase involved in cell wall biosynthesis
VKRHRIEAVAIVVPASNEELLIGACLRSVERAVGYLAAHATSAHTSIHPHRPRVFTIVVDDASTDDTAAIAQRFEGIKVLRSAGGNVGAARALGVEHALAAFGRNPSKLWIANTDADSEVPEHWLTSQLTLADSGSDVVLGTVRPRFADLSPTQIEAWQRMHDPTAANGHVHGANLGLRGECYLRAGGFAALAEHEDVELVDRLRQHGARITASAEAEVVTSGRQTGRTPGGYAGYLRTRLTAQQNSREVVVR